MRPSDDASEPAPVTAKGLAAAGVTISAAVYAALVILGGWPCRSGGDLIECGAAVTAPGTICKARA